MALQIILTSYKRPFNIPAIVSQVEKIAREHFTVTILNCNPLVDLASYFESYFESAFRTSLITHQRRKYPLYRFGFALKSGAKDIVTIDDDILLTTPQIENLLDHYYLNRDAVHGACFGQLEDASGELLRSGYHQGEVAVVNRVYAFNSDTLERMEKLMGKLNISFDDTLPGCDILLSCSGSKAICHDLGKIKSCSTSSDPQIAIHKTPGFIDLRRDLWRKIKSRA